MSTQTATAIVENFANILSSTDAKIVFSVSVEDGEKYEESCNRVEAEICAAVGPDWKWAWNGEGNTDSDGSSTEDATLTRV